MKSQGFLQKDHNMDQIKYKSLSPANSPKTLPVRNSSYTITKNAYNYSRSTFTGSHNSRSHSSSEQQNTPPPEPRPRINVTRPTVQTSPQLTYNLPDMIDYDTLPRAAITSNHHSSNNSSKHKKSAILHIQPTNPIHVSPQTTPKSNKSNLRTVIYDPKPNMPRPQSSTAMTPSSLNYNLDMAEQNMYRNSGSHSGKLQRSHTITVQQQRGPSNTEYCRDQSKTSVFRGVGFFYYDCRVWNVHFSRVLIFIFKKIINSNYTKNSNFQKKREKLFKNEAQSLTPYKKR